jgi:tetratricopeptide (TPR) repeat protein
LLELQKLESSPMNNPPESAPNERTPSAGDCGELAATPLPKLLLSLYRSQWSGALNLTRTKTQKRIAFQKGAPVYSESNLANETLGAQLIDQGKLRPIDHQRVSEYMARKQCKEGVALLALELLEPKGLFLALKEQVRRRLLECFAWPDGSFDLVAPEAVDSEVQALRSDPLALVREGLVNHWSTERMLGDLTFAIERFPTKGKRFDEAERRLSGEPDVDEVLQRIDGTQTLGTTIGRHFNSPITLATIWILSVGNLIRYEDLAAGDHDGEDNSVEPEIEIEVVGSGAVTPRATTASQAPTATSPAATKLADDAAEVLRVEVIERLENLESWTLYQMLGVSEDATDSEIRKAYFGAAKRFHPDALTHLGLLDIKEQAAAVFARIAEANDVLRDPAKRANYNANKDDNGSDIDTRALAQAETSYRKGEILVRMGDFRGALTYLESAVELWPEECEYQSALGWALYKQPKADLERSQIHLEKAEQLDGSNAVALFRLGMVLRAAGETDRGSELVARAKMADSAVN